MKARICDALSYVRAGNRSFMESTFSGRKPGSTARSLRKLWSSKPAPVSSVTGERTSATTITRFVRLRGAPACRAACAGAQRRREIGLAGLHRGQDAEDEARNQRDAGGHGERDAVDRRVATTRQMFVARDRAARACRDRATAKPTAAPTARGARSRSSAGARAAPRPAPSAVRTAISLSRAVARTSMRLATFAQAISSTSATAPSMMNSGLRMSPDKEFLQRLTHARAARGSLRETVSPSARRLVTSASAWSIGRRRLIAPSSPSQRAPRAAVDQLVGAHRFGIQRSAVSG